MASNCMGFKNTWATDLTADDSSAKEELGAIRFTYDSTVGVRGYRYVQAAADTTVANGTVLTFVDATYFNKTVTLDISDSHPNRAAGVGIGAITASNYGWVQFYGYHATVLTDGGDDIADGDAVIVDPSTDGTADSVTAGTAPTHKVLGFACAADVDANNTVAVRLECW